MERVKRVCGSCGNWDHEAILPIHDKDYAFCSLCQYSKSSEETCPRWKLMTK